MRLSSEQNLSQGFDYVTRVPYLNAEEAMSFTPRTLLLVLLGSLLFMPLLSYAEDDYLGELNSNPYDADSTSNPYGQYGSRYSPNSVNNPYGRYGSPYSNESATNPYATNAPQINAPDGTYLGKLSSNPYDPDSTSNPYGQYGSPYSATSINNPYGQYGSPYSQQSPNNPYSTSGPSIYGGDN